MSDSGRGSSDSDCSSGNTGEISNFVLAHSIISTDVKTQSTLINICRVEEQPSLGEETKFMFSLRTYYNVLACHPHVL